MGGLLAYLVGAGRSNEHQHPHLVAGCGPVMALYGERQLDRRMGLAVGRERVPLADVDVDHLRAVDSGVDAGAPVLGGGWSLPRGRTGLPLKLADGRTVHTVSRPTATPVAVAR